MFYTLLYKRRRRKWLLAEARKIERAKWKTEIKETAARDLMKNADRDIETKKNKVSTLDKFIKEEKEKGEGKEKCDMDNIKLMIEQKSKLEATLKGMETGRKNLATDINAYMIEQRGAEEYQRLIRRMIRE